MLDSAGTRLHAFVTVLGLEPALLRELGGSPDGPRWPALLTRRSPPAGEAPVPRDPAFALQQLPDAIQVKADSMQALAESADAVLAQKLENSEESPFTVHAYVPDPRAYRTLAGRASSLGESFLATLRARRPKAFRRYVPWADLPVAGEVLLVQLALVGRTSLLVSAATPRALPRGGHDLAPWPGGRAPVPEDRRAPSRAYRKLVEAFAWMDAAPTTGNVCVDLGGSPGGWAWNVLQRGASVTAVDRAALEPPAAGHPRLTSSIGDAFSYRPAAPVDWLLCDVICRPERTIELCEKWMRARWCRRLIATVKLKGRADDPHIAHARARLAALDWPFLRLKHLTHHHNEVAILARRD
jgi:23S rRNA (cytidine2498-2'-O)-methyltransferase